MVLSNPNEYSDIALLTAPFTTRGTTTMNTLEYLTVDLEITVI